MTIFRIKDLEMSFTVIVFLLNSVSGVSQSIEYQKPRVFVLTDIENEPDDAQSMVRFLVYSNQYDIEGLVASTSIHLQNRMAPQRIRQIVEAYGKVGDNLEKHEPGFPTAEYLLSHISEWLPVYGMQGVGKGKDSPGSERAPKLEANLINLEVSRETTSQC